MQKYFKILVLLLSCQFSLAQQNLQFKLLWPASPNYQSIQKKITYTPVIKDSIALAIQLKSIQLQCNQYAYLNAQFDSVYQSQDTVIAYFNPGNEYKWIKLRRGNVPLDILTASGYREQQFTNKTFNSEQFSRKAERMLQYLENNGYPFAMIKLDSIEADTLGLSASMNLQPYEYIVFDTIEVLGEVNIKKWYLQKYLGIKQEGSYNENIMRQIDSRLSQLPFLKVSRTSATYFFANKAMPILYLENRKASSIDGIIGFAPNTQAGAANNRLLVTGEVNLRLQNIAGTGKSFDLNYRSFLGNSQDLHLRFVFPYIFRTNLAFDYELNLLKQDTTFLDVRNELGIQYRFIGTDYVKLFYQIQSTTLISVDTNQIKSTRRLPDASDIRNNIYGLGFKITRYDYFLNPRKGYSAELNAGVGIKDIIRNPTIEQLSLTAISGEPYRLYDSIPLRYIQYRVQFSADGFIPLFSRAAIRLQTMGGHIESPSLFNSELFRIGGIRTLKGFDEQSIFASTYFIVNSELRYLLQQNSNIMLFWNGAYYRNTVRQPVLSDTPFGFGAGFNFETGAGIFSLFYAVGKEMNNPVQINRAKVHFGFVNYF